VVIELCVGVRVASGAEKRESLFKTTKGGGSIIAVFRNERRNTIMAMFDYSCQQLQTTKIELFWFAVKIVTVALPHAPFFHRPFAKERK
jgi:aryl-alcohol dehydrogenase-like predicted oxidoreductase